MIIIIIINDCSRWYTIANARYVAQYPLYHVAYSGTKFEVATSNGIGGNAFTRKYIILTFDFDLGVKVTQNVAGYPLSHVTYSGTKFEVAMSNGLEGDAFARKYIILP